MAIVGARRHIRSTSGPEDPGVRPTARLLPARCAAPLLGMAAAFVAAGGFVHLREWLDTYRHVPVEAAGSAVVRIGFPVNTAVSVAAAVALAHLALRPSRVVVGVVLAAAAFQAASLGTLVATRTGTVLGWSEPSWTPAADQIRALHAGALVSLAAILAIVALQRDDPHRRGGAAPVRTARTTAAPATATSPPTSG